MSFPPRAEVADGMIAYRFSSAKTQAYLRRKAERLARKETFEQFTGLTKMLAKDDLIGFKASEEGIDATDESSEKDEREEARLESIREGASILRP
jgi:hypothetical protein